MSPSFEYDLPMPVRPSSPRPSHKRHSHPHKYSPSSRAADISRLLDPSYLSSSSTSSSPASVSAYVDHHGDLHDPDYRDFPALPAPRRPAWERGTYSHAHILDDDDLYASPDEDAASDDDERTRLRASSPRDARRRRHAREARLPSQYSSPYSSYASPYAASPFEEPAAPAPVFEKRPRRKLRAKSHPPHAPADEWAVAEEPEAAHDAPKEEDAYVPTQMDAHEWTPTCTQQFRRHWQAFSLSLRFSIFRAQRRMKRKVGI